MVSLKLIRALIMDVGFVKTSKKTLQMIRQKPREYGTEKKQMRSSLDAKTKQEPSKKIKNPRSKRLLNSMTSLHYNGTHQANLDSAPGTHSPSRSHFMKDTNC